MSSFTTKPCGCIVWCRSCVVQRGHINLALNELIKSVQICNLPRHRWAMAVPANIRASGMQFVAGLAGTAVPSIQIQHHTYDRRRGVLHGAQNQPSETRDPSFQVCGYVIGHVGALFIRYSLYSNGLTCPVPPSPGRFRGLGRFIAFYKSELSQPVKNRQVFRPNARLLSVKAANRCTEQRDQELERLMVAINPPRENPPRENHPQENYPQENRCWKKFRDRGHRLRGGAGSELPNLKPIC